MMMLEYLFVVLGAVAVVHGGPTGDRGARGDVRYRRTTAKPYTRSVIKTLTVENGGSFGEWGEAVFCPKDTFATGFQLIGNFSWGRRDNTALDGIALKCTSPDSNMETVVPPEYDRDGNLEGMKHCTKLGANIFYLNGFQLYVDNGYTGGSYVDNSGATNIDFKCRPENSRLDYTLKGEGADWGSTGRWSASCPLRSSICGIRCKIQEYQGDGVDDTGLNDVKFFCCNNPTASSGCADPQGGCREAGAQGQA